MTGHFHKMHGLGNDFVVIDARNSLVPMPPARARAIADRKTGIGCDQLILLEPSTTADVRMRIFNADGGEVESCGNATRCVALLLGKAASIETSGGLLFAEPGTAQTTVTLPPPTFAWDAIPLAVPMDTADMPVAWDELARPAGVNVGNPHVIFFVEDPDRIDLERLGPIIEHDPLFPERVNVNVAKVTGAHAISLTVWERGVGITRACGTGACASAIAAIRSRRVSSPVTVTLAGGTIEIAWAEGGEIKMSGPATHVFTGQTDWVRFG